MLFILLASLRDYYTSGPVIEQSDIFNGEPLIYFFVGCIVLLDLSEQLEVNDRKRRESDTSASAASGKLSHSNRSHTLLPTRFHPQYVACLCTGIQHFKIRILQILVYFNKFPVKLSQNRTKI